MSATRDQGKRGRADRLLRESVHDPYQARKKLTEPTACPACGVVYRCGRWVRGEADDGARMVMCPACRRTRDRVPAGIVMLSGGFLRSHKAEINGLIANVVEREQGGHPLQRIMETKARRGEITITLTDPHLARALGTAIHDAYQGDLDYTYSKDEYLLRVNWTRDE